MKTFAPLVLLTGLLFVFGLQTGKLFATSFGEPAPTGAPTGHAPLPDTAPAAAEEPRVLSKPTLATYEFNRMTAEMQALARRYPGQVAIYVKNLESGQTWSYKDHLLMPSASLIKFPILVGVYEKISKGELRLSQRLTLTQADRIGGSGQLKRRRNGESFTVEELLEELMGHSDNTAMQMLIRAVGLEYLQRRFPAYGLSRTNITRQGLSLRPSTRVENNTTAREMGMLLERVYRGAILGPETSGEMLAFMKQKKHRDRLSRHIPADWDLANKTGLLRRACHDVGIVYSPAGDYVLCVLTWKGPRYRSSKHFISEVGKISYKFFGNPNAALVSIPSAPARNPVSSP